MKHSQKVVISGVSSFVGMHLAQNFAKAGWDVTALTSRNVDTYEGIRKDRLSVISGDVSFRTCDLTDASIVQALVRDVKPNLWIQHGGYAENYASPDYDLAKSLQVNVLALKPLYESLTEVGAAIILTGSSAEYSASDTANSEEDACWPETAYGVSKLAETIEARRLSALYHLPTRIARLYIPVGPYDAPGKLMDHVIKQLKKHEIVDLSPCLQKRDFLSVDDISNAYIELADDMARTEFDVFNICSAKAVELKELLLDLCKVMERKPELLNFAAFPMRKGEAMVSYGDNIKAKKILNWEPTDLTETLQTLISR